MIFGDEKILLITGLGETSSKQAYQHVTDALKRYSDGIASDAQFHSLTDKIIVFSRCQYRPFLVGTASVRGARDLRK